MVIPEQGDLFGDPDPRFTREHARRHDPHTSFAAAESVNGSVGHLMELCLKTLWAAGPGTHTEIARRLGLPSDMVWKRLSDLKNRGLIEDSGSTRLGPSGRAQIVWQVR